MLTESELHFLQINQYPSDFIEFHQQNNNIKVTSLAQVIKESEYFYDLLIPNGYLILAIDGGGNCYVLDLQENIIKFVDHETVYARTSILDELYSEVYGFWPLEDGQFNNPKSLDIKEIYEDVENQVYNKKASYIQEHLSESLEPTSYQTFSELLTNVLLSK